MQDPAYAQFDQEADPILVLDPDTRRICYVNDAATAHYGLQRDDLIGRTLEELRNGEPQAREVEGHSDTLVFLAGDAGPEQIAAGTWPAATKAGSQPTMRSNHKHVAALTPTLLEEVIHTSPDGIMIFEAVRDDGGEIIDFKWLFANPASGQLTHRQAETLPGKQLLQETPVRISPALFEAYKQVVETGEPYHDTIYFELDDEAHWLDVHAVRVNDGFSVTFHDVTERKQIELALQAERNVLRENEVKLKAREKQLHRAQEIAQLGNWEWNVATGKLYWSEEMYRIYGLEPDTPVTFDEFIAAVHPDDRERVLKIVEDVRESRTAQTYFHRMLRPDGTVGILRCDIDLDENARGEIVRMYGTGIDVTAITEAETALRHSEERFRILVEGVKDYAIFSLSPAGIIQSWNIGAQHLKGYSAEEIVGKHISIFYPQEKIDEGFPEYELKVAREVGRFEDEGWRLRKDGSRLWANVIITALYDDLGRFIGYSKVTRDLTERKQHEEALRESEAQLKRAQQLAHIGHWQWNVQTGDLQWSDELYRIYGLEPGEPVSLERFLSFLHPEDRERIQATIQHALETGEPFSYVERIIRPDGEERRLNSSGEVNRGEDGSLIMVGVCHDVTERERAQEALRASEQRFRAIFDSMFQLIGLMSPDGTLIEVNRTALEAGGLNPEEVIGKPFWEGYWWTISEATQAELRDAIARAASGEFVRYNVDILGSGGRVLTIDFSIKPVHNEQGEVVMLIPEGRDISENIQIRREMQRLKEAQQALRESERRYRSLTEATASIVWSMSSEGTFDREQPQWETFTGQTWEEYKDDGWLTAIHPDDQARTLNAWKEALETRSRLAIEHRLCNGGEAYRWMSVRATPVEADDGTVREWIGLHTDIHDLVEMEEALRYQSELTQILTDNATAALFMMDAGGHCTYMNPAAVEMTGYRLDEIREMPLHDAIHHHHPDGSPYPMEECPIDRALPEELQIHKHEDVFIRKNGEFFPVVVSVQPIKRNGVPAGTVVEVRDVTEEKRAEEALQRSEERYRLASRATNDAIWDWNLETDHVEWNEALYELFGYDRDTVEKTAAWWMAHVHPADRERVARDIHAVIDAPERQHWQAEYRFLKADGTSAQIYDRGFLVRNEVGRGIRMLGAMQDHTQQKKVEHRLRFLAKAGTLLNQSLDYETTLRHVAEAAVPEFADWCAVDLLEPDGAIRRLAVAHPDPEKVRWAWALQEKYPVDPDAPTGVPNVLRTGKPEHYPDIPEALLRAAAKDEEHFDIIQSIGFRSVMIAPIKAGNRVIGAISYVAAQSDIRYEEADLEVAEELGRRAGGAIENAMLHHALAESEAQLLTLVDNLPELAWSARPDGYIDFYNKRWYEYTGTTFQEVEGWGWEKLHDPNVLPDMLARWRYSIESGEPFEMEYPLRGADGEFRWFLTRIHPLRDAEGRILRWIGTSTNVNEQKRAEVRLREQARTLEIINQNNVALAAELDQEKLVQAVTDAATELTGAQFGAFFYNVINDKGESYVLYTISGVPREEFSKFPMPRNTAVFHPTFSGEGSVRSDDITKDPRYGKNDPYYGMPEGHLPVRSYLAAPVTSRSGEVIGGLFFGHEDVGVFNEQAEQIVVGIAAQAAVAIDNARLYREAQREIRERKKAETALQRLNEQLELRVEERTAELSNLRRHLELILESAGEGIYGLDAEGRTTFVNEAASEMIGWKPSELIGREQHDVLHHSYADGSTYPLDECPIQRTLINNEVNHVSNEVFWRKDGTCFPVEYVATPIQQEGEVVGAVVVFSDITERKEAEAAMSQYAADLERSNQELQQFAYVASHDLQEPLRMVSGFLDLLSRRYSEKLDDTANSYIHYAVDGATRMRTLINDLLAFSRVRTQGRPFVSVDLNKVMEDVLRTFQHRIAETGATIKVKPLPTVLGDEGQLAQLMQNLIGNAIKFRKPDVPPVVTVRAEKKRGEWVLHVSDNGIGIAPEYTDRVFQIFQRLHGRDQYEGTGIGLAIVKRVVERHGGTIRLSSEAGKGATFSFTLKPA